MDIYHKLLDLLTKQKARYKVIEHEAAGRSEDVSKVRGTALHQGAKAMVMVAKQSKHTKNYYLLVLPADMQVDFFKVKKFLGCKKVMFASLDVVKSLTSCEIGAVPPFSFDDRLSLIVDPKLVGDNEEIAFNAGRLDRSIVLNSKDYMKIAKMKLADISAY